MFTPDQDQKYKVKITQPVGISKIYDLPLIITKAYTLGVENADKDKLVVKFHSPLDKQVTVVAMVRGKIYFSTDMVADKGENKLEIPVYDFPIGVAQVTLFDYKGVPRCERLTFVNKHKKLNIQITTDKEKYLPREEVKMTISTTDEDGLPVPADLSLAIVDDKIISFADDKQDNILSYLLVSSDVKGEIHEPNFYFKDDEDKADQALDYQLMTQGWRHFTWKEILDGQFLPWV